MVPKLAHRKSRNGCKRCKARRVKCDEHHPICNNCHRHGAICEFPNTSRMTQHAGLVPSSTSILTASVPTPPDSNGSRQESPSHFEGFHSPYEQEEDDLEPETRRLLELRLMHHFTTVVSATFPSSIYRAVRELWTVEAIRMAFDHDYLLNAIFAISALHIVLNFPLSPRFLADSEGEIPQIRPLDSIPLSLGGMDAAKAYRWYLGLAVRKQQNAISDISAVNANAIILSSILISYQGLKLLPEDLESREYSPPIQWLYMTNAITQISNLAYPFMQNQSVARFLSKMSGEPNFEDRSKIYNPQNSKQFERLLKYQECLELDFQSDFKAVYEKTLDYVGGVYQAIQVNETPRSLFRRVLCFGHMVPAKFISLVEERRPRALAILAHHCAMAKAVDDHWLIHGFAEREVLGIQSILPLDWQWAMEWPLAMLQRDFSG